MKSVKKNSCRHQAAQFICWDDRGNTLFWCVNCGALRRDLEVKDEKGMHKNTIKGSWEKPKHATQ